MAVRGNKPKPPALKLVTGNPGRRPVPGGGGAEDPTTEAAASAKVPFREHALEPHRKLSKSQQLLWDRFINTAWWLEEHDIPKAFMWVCLQAEYDRKPGEMIAARIAQLRVLGSELGMDVSARGRLGVEGGKKKDPTDKFFE